MRDGLTVHPLLIKRSQNLNKEEIGGLDICKQLNTIGSLNFDH